MALRASPMTITRAREYIRDVHRHHGPPVGALFALGVAREGELVGVATVGRPVARALQDGFTCEVTRLCTDGTRNACSFLYGLAWRIARDMGYRRILTYTLASEPGASLRAAGWQRLGEVRGRSWSCPSRERQDKHPTDDKVRWGKGAGWLSTGSLSPAPTLERGR